MEKNKKSSNEEAEEGTLNSCSYAEPSLAHQNMKTGNVIEENRKNNYSTHMPLLGPNRSQQSQMPFLGKRVNLLTTVPGNC